MKMICSTIPALIASLMFCPPSFAKDCATSLDCDMYENEKCVIPAYSNTGTCLKPESAAKPAREPAPEAPAPSPLQTRRFCMSNKDCDSGQSCVKKENAFSGICQ